ncbi:putative F-box/LRR-repeat protein At5g02930 [Salvia miltiorrhiza]|uniref:putative F-box/LRR-repeat protein At5g02930 n=1 Tax=Salvia miltiorrhiza TaxID=226208 RepID=UPI0025ACB552|nr:putative F-box/LRR-repeat protein At5g02930 [Salvia miltiorrhiza]
MEQDRISQLPDAILLQILSCIDTNQAVQTSILSTRWKNLCFSLSDLHFRLSSFAVHSRATLKNREALSHRFSHSVSHFLSHRDGATTIRNFHLSFEHSHDLQLYADAAFVEECVLHAIDHGVQSLRLQLRCRPELTLPASFFASTTLRELELRQLGCVICVPEQFSLPHLKTLYLESSAFVNDGQYFSSLKEPFSGFPELEKLTLRQCSVYRLVVKAPKLRFLEIVQKNSYYYSDQLMEEISAPLLTWFRYEGYFPFECSKVNLPMLEEVYLDVHKKLQPHNRYVFFGEKTMLLKYVRMLQLLGNAKIVALTLSTLKVLEMDRGLLEQSPCPFPYMKCLKLMKGRREIATVLRRVLNYLTEENLVSESLLKVELPQDVVVVEKNYEDLFEDNSDEQQLELLFGIEHETSSSAI